MRQNPVELVTIKGSNENSEVGIWEESRNARLSLPSLLGVYPAGGFFLRVHLRVEGWNGKVD